ncbi:MAG TPA: glycine cleavage system aminomethyltransferase GcvT [Actinomycetes bacterium]|nr:glycine cleavage system aminomethyltransferase GcvT [Actinomycetes bacterium]
MTSAPAAALRHSPLHERHAALGAKLADFGGWEMPIEYPGGGVIKEHTAVRTAAGIFDVSHLGKAAVRGNGAAAFVQDTLSNDVDRISPGRAQYTLCCDDESGGVVDDLIAYLRGSDDVFLVPNAANTDEVVRRLSDAAPGGVGVENLHEAYGVLAVQGPRSAQLLADIGIDTGHDYMSFVESSWQGRELVVCRTGYTGEHGYELLPRWDDAGDLWDALLAAGHSHGALPCGLGARDTLRTEMGYPLHGQDLSLAITPVQARLGWAVGWKKSAFWGRDVLLAEREAGPRRLLRGLEAIDRGIPRPHMEVRGSDGASVGEVTSGTFSPTRRIGIGLALLASDVSEGDVVSVDVRGRSSRMRVLKPPFVQPSAAS